MKTKILFLTLCFPLLLPAQDLFTGDVLMETQMQWEDNFEVVLANTKKSIQENPDLDAATKKMALLFSKTVVKQQMELNETQQWINGLPSGTYLSLTRYDGNKNILCNFTPELGRVMILDGNAGSITVAYPRLNIALQVTDPSFRSNQVRVSCSKPLFVDDDEVEEINGYEAIPNYGISLYDSIGGPMIDTLTVDGKLYIKVPNAGYILKDYALIVQQEVQNDYYQQASNLQHYEKRAVDPRNYQLPDGYTIYHKADDFVKQLKKAIKKGQLPLDCDLNNPPDNIWDCTQPATATTPTATSTTSSKTASSSQPKQSAEKQSSPKQSSNNHKPRTWIGLNAGAGGNFNKYIMSPVYVVGFDFATSVNDKWALGAYTNYNITDRLTIGVQAVYGDYQEQWSFIFGLGFAMRFAHYDYYIPRNADYYREIIYNSALRGGSEIRLGISKKHFYGLLNVAIYPNMYSTIRDYYPNTTSTVVDQTAATISLTFGYHFNINSK